MTPTVMKKGEDYIGVTVSFLCHDGKGNVLLSKRGTQARDEHGRWDCGGGGVEFGDTVENTLRKEIMEEYCTDVLHAEFLGFRDVFRETDGKKTHWTSLDYLVHVDATKWGNGEPHKLEEVRWFAFPDLPDPMHSQWPIFLEKYEHHLLQLKDGSRAGCAAESAGRKDRKNIRERREDS